MSFRKIYWYQEQRFSTGGHASQKGPTAVSAERGGFFAIHFGKVEETAYLPISFEQSYVRTAEGAVTEKKTCTCGSSTERPEGNRISDFQIRGGHKNFGTASRPVDQKA